MGYRKYAADYRVEYRENKTGNRDKAVRIYIGPWFRFREGPEIIKKTKHHYLSGLMIQAILLLLPLFLDCAYTRLWYIELPAVLCSLPLIFAFSALWRLMTAKERMDREHSEKLAPRMTSAVFLLLSFSAAACLGCIVAIFRFTPEPADWVICIAEVLAFVNSLLLFLIRKSLDTEQIRDPEADHSNISGDAVNII